MCVSCVRGCHFIWCVTAAEIDFCHWHQAPSRAFSTHWVIYTGHLPIWHVFCLGFDWHAVQVSTKSRWKCEKCGPAVMVSIILQAQNILWTPNVHQFQGNWTSWLDSITESLRHFSFCHPVIVALLFHYLLFCFFAVFLIQKEKTWLWFFSFMCYRRNGLHNKQISILCYEKAIFSCPNPMRFDLISLFKSHFNFLFCLWPFVLAREEQSLMFCLHHLRMMTNELSL